MALAELGFMTERAPRLHHLPAVEEALAAWLRGTHHGATSPAQLDWYLDEFTFRFNRRGSTHRGLLFYRLLEESVVTPPLPYSEVVGAATRQPAPGAASRSRMAEAAALSPPLHLTTWEKGANIHSNRTFVRLGSTAFTRRGSRGQDRRAQPGRVDARRHPDPGSRAARPGPARFRTLLFRYLAVGFILLATVVVAGPTAPRAGPTPTPGTTSASRSMSRATASSTPTPALPSGPPPGWPSRRSSASGTCCASACSTS